MQTINDVHQQFAEFFNSETLKPFAYLVSKKLAEGHICLNLQDVEEELKDNPFFDDHLVPNTGRLLSEPLVTSKDGPMQPFVLHNHRLYLQRYFNYETEILERLRQFVLTEKDSGETSSVALKEHVDFIRSLFPEAARKGEINWQLVAAISGVLNNFTIITGGPGTGKTTTVAKILAILYTLNTTLKVALVAPTGKAAVRMAESLKSTALHMPETIRLKFESISPGTIHRLLKYVPDSPYFKHDASNPVNFDVVIVDESSMIDAALFAKLLKAIGGNTKLILLGDKNQLASVEAGSLFGDLCRAQDEFNIRERADLLNEIGENCTSVISENSANVLSEHIVELKKSYRFEIDKGIGKFSKAVIDGNIDDVKLFVGSSQDEQVRIDINYDEKIFESFIEDYRAYINEPDIRLALKKLNNARVLCAVRAGDHGLNAVNKKIEQHLVRKNILVSDREFYANRPLIVTKNYYELNLFNGDVGIIRQDENGVLKAWFEDSSGELKSILPGFISEAETVYAMTIHKSQGSEYEQVLVVLPDADMPLLTAELLYTGVTRAKSRVTIQAPEEVILAAASRRVKRASGIVERFESELV